MELERQGRGHPQGDHPSDEGPSLGGHDRLVQPQGAVAGEQAPKREERRKELFAAVFGAPLALASRYGIRGQGGGLSSIEAQAAMALQALKYELAQCVTLELARDLDTHDAAWADEPPDQLYAAYDTTKLRVQGLPCLMA